MCMLRVAEVLAHIVMKVGSYSLRLRHCDVHVLVYSNKFVLLCHPSFPCTLHTHACTLHTHACAHSNLHVRTHTRTHARTHARTHTHTHAHTRTHTHAHTHAHVCVATLALDHRDFRSPCFFGAQHWQFSYAWFSFILTVWSWGGPVQSTGC